MVRCSKIFSQSQGVEINKVSGPHPSGNVGVQIHHINPINKGDIIYDDKNNSVKILSTQQNITPRKSVERGDDSIMIHLIIILLVSLGIFFFFGTAVGLLRFPDFYTRTHAAGKGDTLSTVLIILVIILYVLDLNHY